MDIVVTGSIAYDYLMHFPGRFVDHLIPEELHQVSLSFLVYDMTRHWGGVAANIAYSMAKLGSQPKLMGTVGRDFNDYRTWLDSAGVDTSLVRQIDNVFTASFFANTDQDNNQIASFYAGAMAHARDYSLADATNSTPDLVVISPNDPVAMHNLTQECRERGIRFVYDPSQQVPHFSGEELIQDIEGAYIMVANAYEISIICEKTGLTLPELQERVDILIVTHGKDGARIHTADETIDVPAFPVDEVKEPTGAGDAFRAGLFTGLAHDLPLKLAGQLGSLCSAYVLEQIGTQNHNFTLPEFVARYRTQFDDQGVLDQLL